MKALFTTTILLLFFTFQYLNLLGEGFELYPVSNKSQKSAFIQKLRFRKIDSFPQGDNPINEI